MRKIFQKRTMFNVSEESLTDTRDLSVSLSEEPDAENLQVRFCEAPGPTDTWLKSCGTAGKPAG